MKRTSIYLVLGAAALAFAATAFAHGSSSAKLTIRHETYGCHAWSLNGGTYKASQSVRLAKGSTLVVIDNDVMAHKLIKTSGPAVTMQKTGTAMHDMSHEFTGPGVMAHMGAGVKLTFTQAGTYKFMTKAGEDYPSMAGLPATKGEDKVLKLTVVVS